MIASLLSFVIASLCIGTTSAQNISAQDATEFALTYGYPLLGFEQFAQPRLQDIGINGIIYARNLANASGKQVVSPNADTLYGDVLYDLSQEDVAFTVPEVPEEDFYLFSFYDPFGNNWANIGTGNLGGAGEYQLRFRPAGGSYGVELRNGTAALNFLNSPTLHGMVLIRWLVNATNIDAVHSYQDATRVHGMSRGNASLSGSPLGMINWNMGNSTPVDHVMNLLAQLASSNPPEVKSDTARVDANLAAAGITGGTYGATSANMSAANASALKTAAADVGSSRTTLNNGWSVLQENKTGDFGLNYGVRTSIASSLFLMLKAPNAVYPGWSNTSDNQTGATDASKLQLGANESYLYTFSTKPPLSVGGFWSLTAYDADDFFIDNPRNIYSLGDRSNITYPSGTRVYYDGSGDNGTHNGMFQILVQPADVTPPANWTSNWLPGPNGGGEMSALLRWFGAEEALLDGSYLYPLVTKQAAFRSPNSSGTNFSGSEPTHAPFDGGAGAGFEASVMAAIMTVAALGVAAFM